MLRWIFCTQIVVLLVFVFAIISIKAVISVRASTMADAIASWSTNEGQIPTETAIREVSASIISDADHNFVGLVLVCLFICLALQIFVVLALYRHQKTGQASKACF